MTNRLAWKWRIVLLGNDEMASDPHASSQVQIKRKFKRKRKQKRNGEDTYGGALRAPRAVSPACIFVFVFVLIYVKFEFSESTRRPPTRKKLKKTTCVSNDASGRDDQFCPKIVKIGAILDYF